MISQKPRIAPQFGLGVGVLAAATASIFIRFAQAEGLASLVIAAARLTLATLVLLPFVIWRYADELRTLPRRAWWLAMASGAFLALHFGAWITSLAYIPVASSVVLVSTAPLFVALVAAFFLNERLTRSIWLGMGLALIGSVLIGGSDICPPDKGCPTLGDFVQGPAFLGDVLALIGATAMGGYLNLGRVLRSGEHPMPLPVYILLTYGAGALILSGVVWLTGLPVLGYSLNTYGWVLLLALIPQLIGHTAFNWALKYLPATYIAVTVLGEPIGSTLLAFLILNETPAPIKLVGGGLLLIGILIASRP